MKLWEQYCWSMGVDEPSEKPAKIQLKLGGCQQGLDSQS